MIGPPSPFAEHEERRPPGAAPLAVAIRRARSEDAEAVAAIDAARNGTDEAAILPRVRRELESVAAGDPLRDCVVALHSGRVIGERCTLGTTGSALALNRTANKSLDFVPGSWDTDGTMYESPRELQEHRLVRDVLVAREVRAAGRRCWLKATAAAQGLSHPVPTRPQTTRGIVNDYGTGFFNRELAHRGLAGRVRRREGDDGLKFWIVSDAEGNKVILRLNAVDNDMECAINKTRQSRWLSNPTTPFLFSGVEDAPGDADADDDYQGNLLGVAVIGYNQAHDFSNDCLSWFVFHSRRFVQPWWFSIDEEVAGKVIVPTRIIPDVMRARRRDSRTG